MGAAGNPMQALLTGNTNGGFSFNNGPATAYRTGLALSAPLVRLNGAATPAASGLSATCDAGSAGANAYVSASGFARSTAMDASVSPATTQACARTRASTISVFPTSFAPNGVLQIDLEYSSAMCTLTGITHAPDVSYDYRVRVRYHDGSGGDLAYREAADIRPTLTDPLSATLVPMSTPVGGGHVLGDYVSSWSALLDNQVRKTRTAGMAAVRIPGVLSITSQPVRSIDPLVATGPPDPSSSVSLTVGAVGCSVEDSR
jgi:hypothetical protein